MLLTHSMQHASHGNGWLLAAIVAVVLWLAALVGALGVDVSTARRNALAPSPHAGSPSPRWSR